MSKNPVTISATRLWPFFPKADVDCDGTWVQATCAACGIHHDFRGTCRDSLAYVRTAFAALGCTHVDAPFVDEGAWFDPRTESSRQITLGDLCGEVSGWVPIQGCGRVGEFFWYFRDRDGAQFGIGRTADAAVAWACGDVDAPGDGWAMPQDFDNCETIPEACAAIEHAFAAWRNAGRPMVTRAAKTED